MEKKKESGGFKTPSPFVEQKKSLAVPLLIAGLILAGLIFLFGPQYLKAVKLNPAPEVKSEQTAPKAKEINPADIKSCQDTGAFQKDCKNACEVVAQLLARAVKEGRITDEEAKVELSGCPYVFWTDYVQECKKEYPRDEKKQQKCVTVNLSRDMHEIIDPPKTKK